MSIYLENHEEPTSSELREALGHYRLQCKRLAEHNRLLEEDLTVLRAENNELRENLDEGRHREVWGA